MDPVTKQRKIRNYKNGIAALWLFAALSIINVFALTYTGSYYVFSSYLLALVVSVLKDLTEIYVSLIVAIVFMAPIVACAIFSRKRYGFMIAGLILVSLDTLLLLVDVLMTFDAAVFAEYILNIVCHAAAIVELAIAVKDRDAVKVMGSAFNENVNLPDSVTTEVLPSGETVSVIDDTDSGNADLNGDDIFGEAFDDDLPQENDAKDKKRLVTITRPKNFLAAFVKFEVVIDGVVVGTLKNGGLLKVMLSSGAHALYVQFANGNSDMLQITSGDQDKNYSIKPVAKAMSTHIEIYEI